MRLFAKQWRVLVVIIGVMVFPILLLLRSANLLVINNDGFSDSLRNEGDDRTIRSQPIVAYRGLIRDRNGELLAVSTPVKTLVADPQLIDAGEIPSIARSLGFSEKALRARLARYQGKRFMILAKHMPPQKANKILAKQFSGIEGRSAFKRFYPAGEVAAHVLGITSVDDEGIEGIELSFNDWLNGEAGSKKVIKDRKKRVIKELDITKAPSPGKDLDLTIDLKLQYLAYKELKHAIAKQGAKSGSLIMVDVETGGVLAMVNQPSYNPNDRSSIDRNSMRNRAVTDVFEPGSTVKPLTIAAALSSGKYGMQDIVDTSPGYIRLGRKTLLDPVNYGPMSLAKILKKSSQVGVTKIALTIPPEHIRDTFFDFGFGQATGIGFPGERSGILPNHSRWTDIARANFAFGYGLTVNALQLAQAYVVLANDGEFVPLSIVKNENEKQVNRKMDKRIARKISKALRSVTEKGGTATSAAVDHYAVAGKTGTAHKVGANGYSDDKYLALFAGYAPASSPKVAVVVIVNEPPAIDAYSGGKAAAPIFSSVIKKTMRVLNVPPEEVKDYPTSVASMIQPYPAAL